MSTTQSFAYTGSSQTFTVPTGVTSLQITAYGGSGGGSNGGLGGYVAGTLAVTSGDTIAFLVGAAGIQASANSPYPNGGAGGTAPAGNGASGGGATIITRNGVNVAIAGGGGGQGRGTNAGIGGAGGGSTGQSGGAGSSGSGAGGGTQSAGGAAGSGTTGGTAGSTNGNGGAGGSNSTAGAIGGGGGGGGQAGGGGGGSSGGANSGGGGGGSNYIGGLTNTTNTQGANTSGSAGAATVNYDLPPNAPTLNSPASGASIDRTITQRFTWSFSDPESSDIETGADIRFSSDGGSTWTTYSVGSSNQYYDVPANTFAAGSWVWQVRTYDGSSVVGPYTASRSFTATAPNSAPNAPTLTSPAAGASLSRTATQRFSWTFSDPDSGDTQSQATVRFSSDGGSTWTNYTVNSATQYLDVAANTFAAGSWVWQVRTADSTGTFGPYTASRSFTAYQPNSAPNAPTLNNPANNTTVDRTASNRFTWTFSDPDAGDSQSKFDFYLALQSAAFPSTPTYTGSTPNQFYDVSAGTIAAGTYQWKVVTYDSQGVAGPASTAAFFTAATPPAGPTITHPTNGSTVGQSDTLTWSVPQQDAYQVQRCPDNAGTIDTTSTPYYDSGQVTGASSVRSLALNYPVNNRYEWVRLRVGYQGTWSTWTAARVLVQFTPPPAATITATLGTPNSTAITFTLATPAPGSGQPAATTAAIAVSSDGGFTVEWSRSNVMPNGTVVFWTPATGKNYIVRVITYSDGGLSSSTGWIDPAPQTITGGTPSNTNFQVIYSGGTP